jgi:hypothetical protein
MIPDSFAVDVPAQHMLAECLALCFHLGAAQVDVVHRSAAADPRSSPVECRT